MIECIPNLCNLEHHHLVDPSPPGEKIIPINFSSLDFSDGSGVDISFRACKSAEALGDWYAERCHQYPLDLVPYLVFKTMHPKAEVPEKPKTGLFKRLGNYIINFR